MLAALDDMPGRDDVRGNARSASALVDVRAGAYALCVVALAFLAGLASAASPWRSSHDARGAPAALVHVVLSLGGVALVTGLLFLWVATPAPARLGPRKRRRPTPKDFEGAGSATWAAGKTAAAAMVAVAALCLAAWPLLTSPSDSSEGAARTPVTTRASVPAEDVAGRGRAVDLRWLILPAALAFALLAPAAVAIRRRRRPKVPQEAGELLVLARAVRSSIARLEDERDHRRAIVLAYECMADAFREAEVVRARDETASEFLLRAIRRLPVGAHAAATLTARFEEARFSTHEIGETHRREALEALRRVAQGLERAA